MNIFYPFYVVYNIVIYIFSIFSNAIIGNFTSSPRKIRWDDDNNTVHLTYSKEEYDRTMIKRDSYSISPFNGNFFQ